MTKGYLLKKLKLAVESKSVTAFLVDFGGSLQIRFRDTRGICYCPVTLLYNIETGNYRTEGLVMSAAFELRLKDAKEIIMASDGSIGHSSLLSNRPTSLRKKMLTDFGLLDVPSGDIVSFYKYTKLREDSTQNDYIRKQKI